MECFQKVSEAIGPVYRRLTAQQGADGGSAYLDLEDSEGLRCGILTWHHVIICHLGMEQNRWNGHEEGFLDAVTSLFTMF